MVIYYFIKIFLEYCGNQPAPAVIILTSSKHTFVYLHPLGINTSKSEISEPYNSVVKSVMFEDTCP